MNEGLKLTIDADVRGAVKGANDVSKALADVAVSAARADSAINKSKTNFTAFTRVIQDLPFGFIAIQNNLEQLVPAAGAAGLAFSGLVAAFTFAQTGLSNWIRKTHEAKEAQKDFNDELLKSREGAEQEVSQLRALESVAANSALGLDKRKQAVKELRDQYPAYFKDLTDEQILTGQVQTATENLTNAIYKRAEARAREADIAKKATKVFENELKISDLTSKVAKQEALIAEQKKKDAALQGQNRMGISEVSGAQIAAERSGTAQLLVLKKELNKTLDENHELMLDIAVQQNIVNNLTGQFQGLGEHAKNSVDRETDAFKGLNKELEEYIRLAEKRRTSDARGGAIAENGHLRNQFIKDVQTGVGPLPKKLEDPAGGGSGVFNKDIEEQNQAAQQRKENLIGMGKAAEFASNAFGNLFDELAKGQNIGEAITNVFKDIAAQIAKAAIKAFVFKTIFSILQPGNSIGSFLDLFKGTLFGGGKIPGFASGGLSKGPKGGYLVQLHGNENVLRPDQMGEFYNGAVQAGMAMTDRRTDQVFVTGRIAGNDIWLSQERTTYQRGLTTGIG